MSSKSAEHHPRKDHPLFSHKFIVIAGIGMVIVFFVTVVCYPLIFSSEKTPPAVPAAVAPIGTK
ncbi:MAG: hypothetical protein K2P92_08220 [Bdellovibrionaceae bacterium]|nr:hypothetical protein [Pseudobdellovibrionaceae bacterium]